MKSSQLNLTDQIDPMVRPTMTTFKSWPSASAIAWPSLLWIGTLHLGARLAIVPSYFSWTAVGICLLLHWITGGIGICMTYHRLLTHRSFATRPRWLEYVLTAIGCCASEGARSAGWRITGTTTPTPTSSTTSIAPTAASPGPTCSGG